MNKTPYSVLDLKNLKEQIANDLLPPDILIKSVMIMPILSYAIETKDNQLIDLLIEKKVNLNATLEGYPPLIAAIVSKNESITDLLLTLGADINKVSNTYPSNALMACAMVNNDALCARLLALGARPELNASHLGTKPCTALYIAVMENNEKICHMLIEHYPPNFPIIESLANFELMLGNNEILENRSIVINYVAYLKTKKEKERISSAVAKQKSKSVLLKI